MELEEKAKELRLRSTERKRREDEIQTKRRMLETVSIRDQAMRDIYNYQDRTGIPTPEETQKHFFEVEAKQYIKGD